MNLQQKAIINEPDKEPLPVYREVFRASHIALLANGSRKTTRGTCGLNSSESSENLSHGTLLAKTLMAYYQQYMRPYAPTWKRKVTKSGRSVYRLTLSARIMKDTGFVSLASPRASQDFKPIRKQTPQEHSGKHGQALCSSLGIIFPERIGQYINPPVCGVDDGVPSWMGGYQQYRQRMQCYGNAVVPQQFYPVFRAIVEIERSLHGNT